VAQEHHQRVRKENRTMEHREYNGWYNYETWVTALWMDNEEPSYRYWREQAQEAIANAEAD